MTSVLKGDLVTTPLPAVLRQLADGVASGCLHVSDGVGDEAKVYVRGGQVYAVQVPGRRPQLGARLVSSGSLGPEALAEALEAQRTELQGWRLGELLVHLGYVDQPVVEAFIQEQVREQTSDLMRWPTGTWKFRVNERTREDVAPPTPVEDLLEQVALRQATWEQITEVLHGPEAVPVLSAAGQTDAEMSIDPEAWSLLCKVDGQRTVTELARECGFTLYEAGQVVYALVRSGLLEVEEVLVGAETSGVGGSVASRLAAAFAPAPPQTDAELLIPHQADEPSPAEVASLIAAALREDRTVESALLQPEEQVDRSIDRVSAALSALLGPTTDEGLFAAPKPRTRKVTPPRPATPAELERDAKASARAERDSRRRSNDAAELASAQAELEAAKAAAEQASVEAHASDHQAEIVNLAQIRVARDEEAEAARAEAERLAAEQAAVLAAEQAAVLAAEQAAVLAAEQAAVLAAEQAVHAAAAAEQAETERLAAEHAALEAAAAEQAEAERLAAEQTAFEQAEAERLAAEEQAAYEQAAAAEQAETERLAAEHAALETAAAEQAETERLAAEHAALEAAAAEQAERLAAEQTAYEQAEAERLAAEEQALSRAAVEEELRLASEQQAADAAAQAEAEVEQARLEQQERSDAEHAEMARLAAQRSDASSAFAELSATAASASDVLEVVPALDDVLVVEDEREEEPAPNYRSADTDMASLFRELSSLGLDDEPPPPPSRPSPSAGRPPAAAPPVKAAAAKKKKGLFGR
jgi:hypothetical protein